jgi:methylamine dehydrogenase heavy chain
MSGDIDAVCTFGENGRMYIMRTAILFVIYLLLGTPAAFSDVEPEEGGVEVLGQPTDDWVINRSAEGAYVFDSATGNMLGLFSITPDTPGLAIDRDRGEAYAAESFLTRLYRGERNDVLTVYDIRTLSPIAEIDIPDKISEQAVPTSFGLLGNRKHLLIYNMTPAQSVTVVDIESRQFKAEISTPGCGMIMPVNDASFLMVCGDGTVQLITLAADGSESNRVRSDKFFSVMDDAVFDRTARTRDGWLLVSHAGLAYDVSADGASISVSEPWSLVSDAERQELWRPGGDGMITVHRGTNLAFVLMHQGGVDTHHEPGSEVWIFDVDAHKRVVRWTLDRPWSHILVLQGERPRLIAYADDENLQVYDALEQRFERTITESGPGVWLLQPF